MNKYLILNYSGPFSGIDISLLCKISKDNQKTIFKVMDEIKLDNIISYRGFNKNIEDLNDLESYYIGVPQLKKDGIFVRYFPQDEDACIKFLDFESDEEAKLAFELL